MPIQPAFWWYIYTCTHPLFHSGPAYVWIGYTETESVAFNASTNAINYKQVEIKSLGDKNGGFRKVNTLLLLLLLLL